MLGFSVYLGHDLTSENYNYLLTMRNSGLLQMSRQMICKIWVLMSIVLSKLKV